MPKDDIDALLNGEESTPTGSQPQKKIQVSDSVDPLDAEQQTPEEVEFNALKGSTQDRIKKILADKNRMAAELEQRSVVPPQQPAPFTGDYRNNPAITDAVRKLDEVGVATKEYTDRQIQNSLARLSYRSELDRLESKYSGNDDRPRFDRTEYEDFVSRHPEYSSYMPEDVYQKMYREELFDWQLSHQQTKKKGAPSLRPLKTQIQESEMTPEQIEARLKEPDAQQWYEANVDKINKVLSRQAEE